MAGLESIALAVAHLERIENEDEDETKEADGSGDSKGDQKPPPSSPFQQSQARMVSGDTRPDKASDKAKGKDNSKEASDKELTEAKAIAEAATTHQSTSGVIANETNPTTAAKDNKDVAAEQQGKLAAAGNPKKGDTARRSKGAEGSSVRPQWGMSLSRTSGKRKAEGGAGFTEAADSGPVASLIAKLSVVTDNLELYFGLIEQLKALADGDPAPLPKDDEPISRVNVNDVLLGRGGETNHHSGNIGYRRLVKASQPAYLAAKRRDKPRIAAAIVQVVRSRSGKFLKKQAGDSTWHDVGNSRAREKTSQALREGAPELRSFVQASKQATTGPPGVYNVEVPPNICDRHRKSITDVMALGDQFYNHHQVANALHTLANAHYETSGSKAAPKAKKRKTVAAKADEEGKLPTAVAHNFSVNGISEEDLLVEQDGAKSPDGLSARGPRVKMLQAKKVQRV